MYSGGYYYMVIITPPRVGSHLLSISKKVTFILDICSLIWVRGYLGSQMISSKNRRAYRWLLKLAKMYICDALWPIYKALCVNLFGLTDRLRDTKNDDLKHITWMLDCFFCSKSSESVLENHIEDLKTQLKARDDMIDRLRGELSNTKDNHKEAMTVVSDISTS